MLVLRVVRRFPVLAYFVLAYAISGLALALIGWPRLDGSGGRPPVSLVMFPVMVITVALVGLALTLATSGRDGLRQLRAGLTRWRLGAWWLVLLVPPLGILAVLTALRVLVSPAFAPQFLIWGLAAGILAGFLEEIGWTGFAYPRLRQRFGALAGALLLGVLWAAWHLPVVDSLGAASPHGAAWPAFFAAFAALVVALRVLIAWVFVNTGSLLAAQLLHASSTGFLVVLGAPAVSADQEAVWYLVYAGLLWVVVGVVVATFGPSLASRRAANPERGQNPAAPHAAAIA